MAASTDDSNPAQPRGAARLLRWLNSALAVVLVLFAVVQYNDPDLVLWVLIYGVAAAWPALAAYRPALLIRRRPLLAACLASLAGFLAYGLYLAPDIKAGWIHIETARESIGLFICIGAGLIALLTARMQSGRVGAPA